MCGWTPDRALQLEGIDVSKETVIEGRVAASGGDAVSGAYVRLLDSTGEFTAEVVTSEEGEFRFFAAPGQWTLRALSSAGAGQATVEAALGSASQVQIQL
jgi:hypothetical protein